MTISIEVIQAHQVPQAKYVICWVVHEIFISAPTQEQVLRLVHAYDKEHRLDDINNFEQHYLKDNGLFLVLTDSSKLVGTGAIRRLDDETAELKRMWFLQEYRGLGLGRQMLEQLLEFAHRNGYRKVRLDTDARQTAAIRLYKGYGFKPIPRYNDSICDQFMELILHGKYE